MMNFEKEEEWDEHFMRLALEEAEKCFQRKEVPVGAVLVKNKIVIAKAHNSMESLGLATAHAEMHCLQQGALYLKNWRLLDTTLYVTLEPCAMCLGALILSRVKRVVWAAPDLRHGACGSWVNLLEKKHPIHTIEVKKGILQEKSSLLLKKFFKQRRAENDQRKTNE